MSFLKNSILTNNDVKLFLRNQNGYLCDAFSVKWTITDAKSSKEVSGHGIEAVKKDVGEYYASWFSGVSNGDYKIKWEVKETSNSEPQIFNDSFYVVDPSSFNSSFDVDKIKPIHGNLIFLSGYQLDFDDLQVIFKDQNGTIKDPFFVCWYIEDEFGRVITQKTIASQKSTGEYYADWFVSVSTGDFFIKWEYQDDAESPLQMSLQKFSVINPLAPIQSYGLCEKQYIIDLNYHTNVIPVHVTPNVIQTFGGCSASVPYTQSNNACCQHYIRNDSFYANVEKVIHIEKQNLPINGTFTSQPVFVIPSGIERISFYIIYQYGAPGGYAQFRIMWGDGLNEYQETIVNSDLSNADATDANQNMFLQNLNSPVPPDGNPINFVLYSSVPGGVKSVRLLCAEAGNVQTPGNIFVALTASTE